MPRALESMGPAGPIVHSLGQYFTTLESPQTLSWLSGTVPMGVVGITPAEICVCYVSSSTKNIFLVFTICWGMFPSPSLNIRFQNGFDALADYIGTQPTPQNVCPLIS